MATKKSTGTTRNYKRKQVINLKDLKMGKYINNAEKPISVLVGLLAGSPIAIWIDKQMTAKKVFGMEGDKLKKWVKPGANFILGMSTHFLAKDERLKLAGIGLAANGGLIALKELLGGKDLLKGLVSEIGETSTSRYLGENVLPASSTPLNLPLLTIDDEASDIIDKAAEEPEEVVEGNIESNIEGNLESTELQIGKTEDQIAGESESVMEDNEYSDDMDEIP